MTTAREKWDSLPKFVRGALVFGLGGLATSTFFLSREGATGRAQATPQISYAVGVICASHAASVSYYEDADEYRLHCTAPDGEPVDVTQVQNLDVTAYEEGEIHGFNKIVPITLTGETIEFNMQGPDAIATVYNSGYNDPTTGIVRVTN